MDWILGGIKDFLIKIFGNFWGSLFSVFMKILMGPFIYFILNPIFGLISFFAELLMETFVLPHLNQVGLDMTGLAGWLITCLRFQECLSILLSFYAVGFLISLIPGK
ncbi:hypothetical protein C4J81_00365 [Deltaproteobacteria bacterium Smac51]|nr:hypothetical protein C4J81_00285 [Deltaproteobacteria bacterium Smac51]UQZ87751.1 hypothetical protein C4J81_00365 [Deltaproteobacteria bacterium Smac51]